MIAGHCWKTFCATNKNHTNNLKDMGFKFLRIFLNLADLPYIPLLSATSGDSVWRKYIDKIYNELPDGMWAWTFEDYEKPFWCCNNNETFKDNIEFCKREGWLPIICAGHSEEQESWITRAPSADKWPWLKRFSKELGLYLKQELGFGRADFEIWNEPNECMGASHYSNVALHMCMGYKTSGAGKTHIFGCDIKHQDYLDYLLKIQAMLDWVDYISPHILTYEEWDSNLLDTTYNKVRAKGKKLSLLEISPLDDMGRLGRIVNKCDMYALVLAIRNSNVGTAFDITDLMMYDFDNPSEWVSVAVDKMRWLKEFNKKYTTPLEEEMFMLEKYYYRLKTTYNRDPQKAGIKFIQSALGLKPDGIFGLKTEQAVMAYQISKGLADDGIVGPSTFGALYSEFPRIYDDLHYNVEAGIW